MDFEERKKIIDKAVETYQNIDAPMCMALVQEQIKEIQSVLDLHAQVLSEMRGIAKPEPWQ